MNARVRLRRLEVAMGEERDESADSEEVDVELMGAFGRLPVDEMIALALLAELSLGDEPREPITPAVIANAARGRARLAERYGAERVFIYFPEVEGAKR